MKTDVSGQKARLMTREQNRESTGRHSARYGRLLGRTVLTCLAVLSCGGVTRAHAFDSSLLTFFPNDVTEFAYIDLGQARSFPCYTQIRSQLVPASIQNFEDFLSLPYLGGAVQVDGAAWGIASEGGNQLESQQRSVVSSGLMGIIFGHFDPETAEAFLRDRKIPSEDLNDYTAYASTDFDHDPAYASFENGTIWFVFVDSSTVAFGPRGLLEKMINAHEFKESNLFQNADMLALIDRVEKDGMFWGVFDTYGTRTVIGRLTPDVMTSKVMGSISTLLVNIDPSFQSTLEIHFRIEAGSPLIAASVAGLLAKVTLARAYVEEAGNPDLASILKAAQISSSGSEVVLSLTPTNDQVLGLVDHDFFVPKQP
jgi:hypothetical protein